MNDSILAQLRDRASTNGFGLRPWRKVVQLLTPVLADSDRIINVFVAGGGGKPEYLVVTDSAVHQVRPGQVALGNVTSIRLDAITKVDGVRRTFDTAQIYELDVQSARASIRFKFAFEMPGPVAGMGYNDMALDIGRQNMMVAIDEIERARSTNAGEDPDLAHYHRTMAAHDAEPFAEGKFLPPTADEATALVTWMGKQYAAGEYLAVWHYRLSMGFGVDTSNFSDEQTYWFHAYSALSALRLGRNEHTGVPMSAGAAEQSLNKSDSAQVAAQQEIERRYFGEPKG